MAENVVTMLPVHGWLCGGNPDDSRGAHGDSHVPAVDDSQAQDGADPVPGSHDNGEALAEAGQAACLPGQRSPGGIRSTQLGKNRRRQSQRARRFITPLTARYIQHEAAGGIPKIAAYHAGQAIADVILQHDELRNARETFGLMLPDPLDGVQGAFPGQQTSRNPGDDPVLALRFQFRALLKEPFILPVDDGPDNLLLGVQEDGHDHHAACAQSFYLVLRGAAPRDFVDGSRDLAPQVFAVDFKLSGSGLARR